MHQLTCNIDLSNHFRCVFFSFVLIELKPFVLKGKVLGKKIWKSVTKCEKSAKNSETILPFSCCPVVFPWRVVGCFSFPEFWPKKITSCDGCFLLSLADFLYNISRLRVVPEHCWLCRLVSRMAQKEAHRFSQSISEPYLETPPKALLKYCWLSRLVLRIAWNYS